MSQARPISATPCVPAVRSASADSGSNTYIPIIRLPMTRVGGGHAGTSFIKHIFNRTETNAIKEKVRANRVTMHGTVAASLLKAIHVTFGLDTMTRLSTVEFRRQGTPPLPADTFGCYVDMLRTRHRLDAPFWSLAQEVTFKLITALLRDQANTSVIGGPSLQRPFPC